MYSVLTSQKIDRTFYYYTWLLINLFGSMNDFTLVRKKVLHALEITILYLEYLPILTYSSQFPV